MQAKVIAAKFDTVPEGPDAGKLTGGIAISIEWLADSELEHFLLTHLLSGGAHESAVFETSNFGEKLISKGIIKEDGRLDSALMEMQMFQEWKSKGENWNGSPVSFEQFKQLKAEAVAAPAE